MWLTCVGNRLARVAPNTLIRARSLRRRLTGAEAVLWSRLRDKIGEMRFRKQHSIGPYIADFACIRARLVVEVDGATHGSDREHRYDARREAYLRSRRCKSIRVSNDDVYHFLIAVLELIYHHSRPREPNAPSTASRSPSPMLRTREE